MELDYCGEKILDPTLEQIFEYLTQLTDDANSFMILCRSRQVYVQACKSGDGYCAEFRQGCEDQHFSSVRDDLSLDEAKTIFEKTGPLINRNVRFSSRISEPIMSEGIRSGVNCILLKDRPKESEIV